MVERMAVKPRSFPQAGNGGMGDSTGKRKNRGTGRRCKKAQAIWRTLKQFGVADVYSFLIFSL